MKLYREERSDYLRILEQKIRIAGHFHDFHEAIPNYIEILAVVPIGYWSVLEKVFFGKRMPSSELQIIQSRTSGTAALLC